MPSQLKLSFHQPRSHARCPRDLYSPKEGRTMNIYVGNLDFKVTEDELRQAFSAYGQVDNVTILKDRDTGQPRGFGFVEMGNSEEAQKAISSMNEARPKEARAGAGGGRGGFGGGRGGGGGRGRSGGGGGFRNRY